MSTDSDMLWGSVNASSDTPQSGAFSPASGAAAPKGSGSAGADPIAGEWNQLFSDGSLQKGPSSSSSSPSASSSPRPSTAAASSPGSQGPGAVAVAAEAAAAAAEACVDGAPVGTWITPRSGVDAWLGEQFARVQELQEVEDVGLFVGTWNVNGKVPAEDITPWIRGNSGGSGSSGGGEANLLGLGGVPPTGESSSKLFPRVWVFCLQEMVDLDASNLVDEGLSKRRLVEWERKLLGVVQAHAAAQADSAVRQLKFRSLCSKSMVGVALIVLADEALHSSVRNNIVEAQQVGTGAMDMGNKGGVGVRFELRDTSLCFVSSHLAAHRDKVQNRNDDFAAISRRLLFEHVRTPDYEMEKPGAVVANAISYTSPIDSHDVVVWAGDLNYRVHVDLPVEMVLDNAKAGNLDLLLAKDQLLNEMFNGRVFQGYAEGPITFPPTYKYEAGTRHYDERARPGPEDNGKKKKGKLRAPAWCDRILWRTAPLTPLDESPRNYRPLEQLEYFSVKLIGSDHMPVGAFFRLRVRSIDASRRLQAQTSLYNVTQCEFQQPLGRIRLEPDVVAFPRLSYHSTCSEHVRLVNEGTEPQRFCVLPSSHSVHPPELRFTNTNHYSDWLAIRPTEGVIPPGQSVQLKLHARANVRLAARLMRGRQSVGATIMLRPEHGQDQYLYVSGFYRQSAFGVDLEELLYHVGPISKVVLGPADGVVAHAPKPQTIPKEVWMLADALTRSMAAATGPVGSLFGWCGASVASAGFRASSLLNPGLCGPTKKVDAANLYGENPELEAAQASIRRAVDNYQVLAPELVANPAALVRSLLCLLASIWQHAKVPAELVDRMTNDPDDASALRTYLWHIGPAYKGTFLYLASLAAFMSKSAGQDEAEVVGALSVSLTALHAPRLRKGVSKAMRAALRFVEAKSP
eukprot:INCI17920.1.p1 GENE.INCI17920.1~~INCI17920.1.p1  ORF type:complete len:914 (+),score=146.20 INCI17920.1:420-3161(+)